MAGEGFADHVLEEVDEIEERDPGPEGQIDGLEIGNAPANRLAQYGDHRADVGEVTGLAAVAMDGQRFATESRGDEGRHDSGISVVGGLQRAENVEEAEREDR